MLKLNIDLTFNWNYMLMDASGKKTRSDYYQAVYQVDVKRKPQGPFIKFILPLAVIVLLGLFLEFMPLEFAGDTIATSYSMVVALVALYLSYVTVVNVYYPTLIDGLFFAALGVLLVSNIIFIFLNKSKEVRRDGRVFHHFRLASRFTFFLSSILVLTVCAVLAWRVGQLWR